MYKPRLVEEELESLLATFGAVVIEGPKASGKTETARRYAASEVLMDVDENAQIAMGVDPSFVLQGETPRLLDEWQIEPRIWNHIRREVDRRKTPGQFILTGSAVPADDITRHTGAGRLARLLMRPMSLHESESSSGEVSLAGLFRGEMTRMEQSDTSIQTMAEFITRGGWPSNLDRTTTQCERFNRSYIEEVRRTDINRVDIKSRDPVKVGRLLKSLARNVSTEVSMSTLAEEAGGPGGSLGHDTVRDYLGALERLMVIEDQPAWSPHLRSKSILRTSPKRHFIDPSIATATLGISHQKLVQDLKTMGFFFESMVIRDLRIYAQGFGGKVFHYRDNTGLEVDAIVELEDGSWGAFEVKLGAPLAEAGAKTLKAFKERVDTKRCGEPSCLAVIVATGLAHTRPDGVHVIPITSLGP